MWYSVGVEIRSTKVLITFSPLMAQFLIDSNKLSDIEFVKQRFVEIQQVRCQTIRIASSNIVAVENALTSFRQQQRENSQHSIVHITPPTFMRYQTRFFNWLTTNCAATRTTSSTTTTTTTW